MRVRLQQLMDKEGVNPAKFAEIVGVQRSSVSHILSGRNNPSLEFIQKILTAYPSISSDWLISGTGNIYRDKPGVANSISKNIDKTPKPDVADLFSVIKEEDQAIYSNSSKKIPPGSGPTQINKEKNVPDLNNSREADAVNPENLGIKSIERIVIFYSDHTFISYNPE